MANLSQQKRARMMEFISQLREEHKDDDSALAALGEIENDLNAKKYGLVWEEHVEKVDVQMQNYIPVFSEADDKEINQSDSCDYNFLLEGDNLHSLYLLEKTHKGKIDVIYIDPPYNTGNKDFMYDDNYINTEDGFRHSKWLSFMEKRLKVAKNLLSDDGLICISIDDNEFAPLKLLCDDIFDEINCLSIHHLQVRYDNKSLNEKNDWQPVIEYVLIYAKNKFNFKANKPYDEYDVNKFVFSFEELTCGTEIEMGGKKVTIFKPSEWKISKSKIGAKNLLKETWASGSVLKGNTSGKFFDQYISKRKDIDGINCLYRVEGIGEDGLGYRYFTGPKKESSLRGKFYSGIPLNRLEELEQGTSKKYKPITNFYNYSADFGNIRHEGGVGFNSGKKPVKMLKHLINYHQKKDVTVLDFFAGSGSTGHAVLDLNQEDNGTRKFILCTNNENNICEDITYQRLKTVITGLRQDGSKYSKGIPSNLKYYKTGFVAKDEEFLSDALLDHIKEMVQLEHGVKVDGTRRIIVMSEEEVDELEANWNDYRDVEALYVSRNVLLNTQQNAKFKNVDIYVIPDYYFNFELKEVGLSW